jgi:bacteriophage HK97-gp10 putative tail-component
MISFSGAYNWFGAQFQRYAEWRTDVWMERVGEKMAKRAQSLAPVDTGRLKWGIISQYRKQSHEILLISHMYYGEFQEFGTVHFKAHPHIRPAVEYGSRLLGGTGNIGMMFSHTARLKGNVANPRTARHHANMASNLATSRRFNQGPAGRANQYLRSYRGGPGS